MPGLQTAQVSNYDFGAPVAAIADAVAATAVLAFGSVATNGDLVQIGTPRGVYTFEYTAGTPAAGHIGVAVGLSATDSAQNLKAAINAIANFVVASGSGASLTLTESIPGAAGNLDTVSKVSTAITVTTWSGGVDASASEGVLQFVVGGGGKLILHFENPRQGWNGIATDPGPSTPTLTYSVQVSVDGVTWAATTSSNNVAAITAETLAAGQSKDYVIVVRAGIDKFVRLNVSGGGRGLLQIRANQAVRLDLVRM